MLIATTSDLKLARSNGTISRMLHLQISLMICTLFVVTSDQFETVHRKHHANHYFVPQPIFLDDLYQPTAELKNNRTIYYSLNKILNQLKSQLIGNNNIVMSRIDDEKSATKLNYEILHKNHTKSASEQPKELLRMSQRQSAINRDNETATTTINVPIQPFQQDGQYYQPTQESHTTPSLDAVLRLGSTPASGQQAHKVTYASESGTTSLPFDYSSRLIDRTTGWPRRQQRVTTRRSAFMQDDEELIGDEDETESGGSTLGPGPLDELGSYGNSNQNSLFSIRMHPSIKNAGVQKNKKAKLRSPPVYMATGVGSANSHQANVENSPPMGINNELSSSSNYEHASLGQYKRRHGQKPFQLPIDDSTSPLRVQGYSTTLSKNDLPAMDPVDAADDGGDLRSTTQLASTNEATYLDDPPNTRWPNLNPQSIELRKVPQQSSLNQLYQPARVLQERDTTRSRSQMSSSGPLATLFGSRDPMTGQTSYQQMSHLQSQQQQQAQQSTIHSQRDLLNQPQTIQITAVPNNGLVNGLNNQLIRINALGANGNLLTNGLNNVWNNGYLDPFGRQVMMVNAERRQIDWSVWIWPLIAVVTLPMILGALFVPVFLKTIVVLIQILQSLGLLLPIASALGQQIAQASGVTGVATAASSTSATVTGNNQLEHVAN